MTNIQEEIWKETLDGKYKISSLGRLMGNGKSKKIIKLFVNVKGYYRYHSTFHKKNFSIHRLVAESFIPNPDSKPQVNHIDGNRLNNEVSNLEWCTASENQIHCSKIGLRLPSEKQRLAAKAQGENMGKRVVQYDLLGNKLNEFQSGRKAAKELGLNEMSINRCARGERKRYKNNVWKYA